MSPEGGSIFMTSAPMSASNIELKGPATLTERSSMRIPASGALAVFSLVSLNFETALSLTNIAHVCLKVRRVLIRRFAIDRLYVRRYFGCIFVIWIFAEELAPQQICFKLFCVSGDEGTTFTTCVFYDAGQGLVCLRNTFFSAKCADNAYHAGIPSLYLT